MFIGHNIAKIYYFEFHKNTETICDSGLNGTERHREERNICVIKVELICGQVDLAESDGNKNECGNENKNGNGRQSYKW